MTRQITSFVYGGGTLWVHDHADICYHGHCLDCPLADFGPQADRYSSLVCPLQVVVVVVASCRVQLIVLTSCDTPIVSARSLVHTLHVYWYIPMEPGVLVNYMGTRHPDMVPVLVGNVEL